MGCDIIAYGAVLLFKESVDLYNGKTIRPTMGSLFYIPVIQNLDTVETIAELKEETCKIITCLY
ncbi:MAG TPA: 23S rRNA (guanosine(2251)-2'-O)-methyltransferase RlmB, partial [Clostridia bacterium]|nr:23S rRNA (guanosine(2251)-2'-O)-methyltransferase RlmB [Clostridia bacterium]